MRSRYTHTSKSRKEKEYYTQKIHKLDNDPTVDDSLSFPGSDSTEEDLRISETKKMQKMKFTNRLIEYLQSNWIGWLVVVIAAALSFFIYHFNGDIGEVKGRLFGVSENISRIESLVKENLDENHKQDLLINENRIRMNFLEKEIDKNQSN
jgi:hypothetical protein